MVVLSEQTSTTNTSVSMIAAVDSESIVIIIIITIIIIIITSLPESQKGSDSLPKHLRNTCHFESATALCQLNDIDLLLYTMYKHNITLNL